MNFFRLPLNFVLCIHFQMFYYIHFRKQNRYFWGVEQAVNKISGQSQDKIFWLLTNVWHISKFINHNAFVRYKAKFCKVTCFSIFKSLIFFVVLKLWNATRMISISSPMNKNEILHLIAASNKNPSYLTNFSLKVDGIYLMFFVAL